MNILPVTKTIKDILKSGKKLIIPRFQREYSWEKKNYIEFINDILSELKLDNENKIIGGNYFLGTMLFVGDFANPLQSEMYVVDGQQRLTTITILFSVLSKLFMENGEDSLSKLVFEYIVSKDDDGNEIKLLHSNTSYPYFAYYIQSIEKDYIEEIQTEEEQCIYDAYNSLLSELSEVKLRKRINDITGYDFGCISYVELLKQIRDQVLNSVIVSITTTDKDSANKIFEILNSKGKKLAAIDLIKNKLFEKIDSSVPVDFAEEQWKKLVKTLNSNGEMIGLATYYRHFWCSKYKKSSNNSLYDDFKAIRKSEYKDFLLHMVNDSKNYMKIINPKREDYNNKKDRFPIVQSLHVLEKYFRVVVTRIVLLSLFDVWDRGIVSTKEFKRVLFNLENFHFAYTAIASKKSNSLEAKYSKFAIELRACKDKNEANIKIQEFSNLLASLLPEFEVFKHEFVQIVYSKNANNGNNNMKAKYILNKMNQYYQGLSNGLFDDHGSVEHIIPETNGGKSLNIGNLILLEEALNIEAGEKKYSDKKEIYKKSRYTEVVSFVDANIDWNEEMIEKRAEEMAKVYYDHILKIK